MGFLEKTVGFKAIQFEELSHLSVRDLALAESLDDEGLQRLSRKLRRLCAERLDWLDRTLAGAPDRPTLVMMHHPPFVTGIDYMDKFGLENTAGLAAVIARHPQVERILCGHLHRPIDRRFAGTVAGTAPSTAHQIGLDLVPAAPLHFMFEPPGYQLHLWREDSGLVTHTAVLGDWPGSSPFRVRE